jgi:hypothetical protein
VFIKFKPQQPISPGSFVMTNLGEFSVGRVAGPFVSAQDVREAQRLVDNGDFVVCGPDGTQPGAEPWADLKTDKKK